MQKSSLLPRLAATAALVCASGVPAAVPAGNHPARIVLGKNAAQPLSDRPGQRPTSRLETAFQHNEANQATLAGVNMPQGVVIDSTGHLYVADTNNHRILAWTSAAAATTGQSAALVIGQRDGLVVRANAGYTYAAACTDATLNLPAGLAVDSTGALYVADTGNHRVLRYDAPFTQNPAAIRPSLVFGHDDYFHCAPLHDGVLGAASLYGPVGVAIQEPVAGGRFLYVSDTATNRVLQYDLSQTDPTQRVTADRVWGQVDFTSPYPYAAGSPNAGNFYQPGGLRVLPDGTMAVVDYSSHRALIFPPASGQTYPAAAATIVLGQTTASAVQANQNTYVASASSLYSPRDIAITGTAASLEAMVVDYGNNRAVVYSGLNATGAAVYGPSATRVVGQPYQAPPNNTLPDFAANRANNPQPGAATLNGPTALYTTGSAGQTWILDGLNHRVLHYGALATAATAADRALGQTALNRINGNGPGSAGGMFQPSGVAVDERGSEHHLYVADSGNHRILAWREFRTYQPGRLPDLLIGQPDLYSVSQNRGGSPAANSLYDPGALVVGPTGELWVADRGNNRVLRFPDPFGGGFSGNADLVLGQPGFTTRTANLDRGITGAGAENQPCYRPPDPAFAGLKMPTDECALWNPTGIALDGASVWVADQLNNRLLRYDTLTNGAPAARVLGRTETFTVVNSSPVRSGLSFYHNTLLLTAANTLAFPVQLATCTAPACIPSGSSATRVIWVADSGNSRVIAFDVTSVSPTVASAGFRVVGEPDFVTRAGGAQANLFNYPNGIALSAAGDLWVADTGNSRAVGVPNPAVNSASATALMGQKAYSDSDPNPRGVGRASALAPRAIALTADGFVVVADTDNNRVLVYHP